MNDSDHLAVVATYAVPCRAGRAPQRRRAGDDPDHAVRRPFERSMRPSGRPGSSPARRTRPCLSVAGGMLRIGALKDRLTGAHYNGISSAAYNVSNNGCAAVQLAQAPESLDHRLCDVRDRPRHQQPVSLVSVGRRADCREQDRRREEDPGRPAVLGDGPPVPADSQGTNLATGTQDVVFETAPNSGGVPGTYTERYQTYGRRLNAIGLKFEIKAGTSVPETSPGPPIGTTSTRLSIAGDQWVVTLNQ